MSAAEPLLPPIVDLTRPFWEAAKEGRLVVQRCPVSGRHLFPPREFSPYSPGVRPEWVEVSGRGTIWSFIVPHPPLLPWYAERAPYNVILVELDEDPTARLTGNLVRSAGGAINEIPPEEIVVGSRVRVCFDAVNDQIHMPRWVLDEG